jgi:hypothetical protein
VVLVPALRVDETASSKKFISAFEEVEPDFVIKRPVEGVGIKSGGSSVDQGDAGYNPDPYPGIMDM